MYWLSTLCHKSCWLSLTWNINLSNAHGYETSTYLVFGCPFSAYIVWFEIVWKWEIIWQSIKIKGGFSSKTRQQYEKVRRKQHEAVTGEHACQSEDTYSPWHPKTLLIRLHVWGGQQRGKDKERSYEPMSVCVLNRLRESKQCQLWKQEGKEAERTTRRVNNTIESKQRSAIHLPMRVK